MTSKDWLVFATDERGTRPHLERVFDTAADACWYAAKASCDGSARTVCDHALVTRWQYVRGSLTAGTDAPELNRDG